MSFRNAALDKYDAQFVSQWPFDPADSFRDVRGNNPGTNIGVGPNAGTTDVAGIRGRGRNFIGATSDHIDFGNGAALAPTVSFTLAIWVNFTFLVGPTMAIMGKHDSNAKRSYLITAVATNALRGIISSDGSNLAAARSFMTTNNGVLVPGSWQLIIFSFSIVDKTIRIYVDNVDETQAGDTNAAVIATFADVNFAIGATHASGVPANFLTASGDEPMFWNGAQLDAPARSALWNGGAGTFWSPTGSTWKMARILARGRMPRTLGRRV